MKNNKKIVLAVVALVAVVAIALGLWVALKPQAAQGEKTITVNVVFADGIGWCARSQLRRAMCCRTRSLPCRSAKMAL